MENYLTRIVDNRVLGHLPSTISGLLLTCLSFIWDALVPVIKAGGIEVTPGIWRQPVFWLAVVALVFTGNAPGTGGGSGGNTGGPVTGNPSATRSTMVSMNLLMTAAVALTLAFDLVACQRKRPDESPADFKARKLASTTAQSYKLVNAWADSAEALKRGQVLADARYRDTIKLNEKTRLLLEQIAEILKGPKPSDAIGYIEQVIAEIEKAEKNGVFTISNPQGQERYQNTATLALFSLKSLRSTLKAIKPPDKPTKEARSLLAAQPTKLQWVLDLISIAEATATDLYLLGDTDTADAWTIAEQTNELLKSKNAARLNTQ